jgi:calcium-dependent protein kinase
MSGFVELIKHGIVHRDLKPADILIHQGSYKIAGTSIPNTSDFGFAKCVANFQNDMLGSAVGTPLYMSPQMLHNDRYTNKTDIWSLGFIFYQTLYSKSNGTHLFI